MKLVFDIILIVLKVLIAIGDYVRYLFGLIGKGVASLAFSVFTSFKNVLQKTKKLTTAYDTAKRVPKKHKEPQSKPPTKTRVLTFSNPFKNFHLPKFERKQRHYTLFKRRRKTRLRVAPTSLSFLSKFKYFIGGTLFSFFFIFVPLVVIIFLQSLPNPNQLTIAQAQQTTKIYDRNGTLLYQIYANQNRTLVPLATIPKQLQQATIAIEDKKFYESPGFDITAIMRSAIADFSGKPLQGGSTITQQLIKSTLLTPEQSFDRKIKEIILAFWAQRIYTKDQILQMYFNQVAYGGTAYGVEAAAETYFGKHVGDLDLAESAFLAGLPQAPSTYSPYGEHPNAWRSRQVDVLNRMADLGYITKAQRDDAKNEALTFQPPQTPIHAPHFVMYVKDYLSRKYGLPFVERGGLTVITSLDLKTQDIAQKVVSDEVDHDGYLNISNAAALVTNPKNGDILAMIGSHNYDDPNGGANNLTTALRQPGSSIKVVTYSAALSKGFTPATVLDDSPVNYNGYSPVNYDGKFHGRLPLRLALANSLNIPAVKTLNQIGIDAMVGQAKKMGITTFNDPSRYGLSITLGGVEVRMVDMAEVFGTLANQGKHEPLNPILKITDGGGNVIEEKDSDQGTSVLDAGIAYIMTNILADNNARSMEFGPNSPLYIANHNVSVKTGTTDNKKDNWTFGYTPNFVVSAWVGNNDGSFMSQALASGITGAAPIWHNIMTNLLQTSGSNQAKETYSVPSDVIQKSCYGHPEYFIKGTENSVSCAPLPSNTPSPTPAHKP